MNHIQVGTRSICRASVKTRRDVLKRKLDRAQDLGVLEDQFRSDSQIPAKFSWCWPRPRPVYERFKVAIPCPSVPCSCFFIPFPFSRNDSKVTLLSVATVINSRVHQ